ncbi:MAG: hypothetical protein Q7U13_02930 [Rhodoferax sp.]|nr:hypothetical protein [Rhodoferax sp.]
MLKEKKPQLVRDSLTIPEAEYTLLDELKRRAGKLGSSIKRSELIRAGIKALAVMLEPVGYIPPAEVEENYYRQLASQAVISG